MKALFSFFSIFVVVLILFPSWYAGGKMEGGRHHHYTAAYVRRVSE